MSNIRRNDVEANVNALPANHQHLDYCALRYRRNRPSHLTGRRLETWPIRDRWRLCEVGRALLQQRIDSKRCSAETKLLQSHIALPNVAAATAHSTEFDVGRALTKKVVRLAWMLLNTNVVVAWRAT
jgi:hypothetical protein